MVELSDLGILNMKDEEEEKKNEAIKTLFDFGKKEDIKTKTDLSANEIKRITKIKVVADYYNIGILNNLIDYYCLFKVSKERLGRSEVVNMLKSELNIEDKNKSLYNKLFK